MTSPTFPPLFSGLAVSGENDPFDAAVMQAVKGCDSGLVVYNLGASVLRAAIVLTPEVPLEDAMAMVPACGIGFQNALGALAPPEVAVHLDWFGGIKINGATCGRLRVRASGTDPDAVPDWLIIGLELPLWPTSDDPGQSPDQTALYAEGCVDVDAAQLLESWTRHTLVWINRWSGEGVAPLHSEWRGLAMGIGKAVNVGALSGTFVGVDERFGMLVRDEDTTHLVPLSSVLENDT
jgi:BirA family biotin operon repressor/biotin-[acetyl-CoA-carboxylase] ligase